MSDLDLRTRKGRETEVVVYAKLHGGFTIFWATESQKRAHAIARLESSGRIARRRDLESGFPFMRYEVREP